jgi:hypothetical protein
MAKPKTSKFESTVRSETAGSEVERIAYRPRITAFIDVLGMRHHVRNPTGSGADFVRKFVELIRSVIGGSCELPAEDAEGLSFPVIPLSGWDWTEQRDLMVTSMSDSIVISLPDSHGFQPLTCGRMWPTYIVMEYVFWLQRALLQLGVLSRGAIAVGNLHHSKDIVAGDALIEAYEQESALAIYPRAILSQSVVDLLLQADIPEAPFMADRIASLFAQDSDGLYFIDYLGLSVCEVEMDWPVRLKRIRSLIAGELEKSPPPRVRQKLGWLRSYAEAASPDWSNPRPHARQGALEERFPRFSALQGDTERAPTA